MSPKMNVSIPDQERINELLSQISDLQAENQRLKRIINENGIEIGSKESIPIKPAFDENQGIRIKPEPITRQHVRLFFSRFWGREDVYSKRVVKKNGEVGYFTQCKNFWKAGCYRKTGSNIKCQDCKQKEYRPVEEQQIFDHLTGKEIIGIYPFLPDGTCRFLVFDFDNHAEGSEKNDFANETAAWMEEVGALRLICLDNGIDPLVERSRSGRGAHVWIFFEKPIPVKQARAFGNALLEKGASSISLKTFAYYDRMLPAQDFLSDGAIGNLIALPLQPEALKKGNSAFVDDAWNAYPDQWKTLLSKPKLTLQQLQDCVDKWSADNPFKEADQAENEEVLRTEKQRGKPWENRLQFNKDDVYGEMKIVMSDLTYIDTIQLQPRLQNQIRRLAAFGNPVFYKNQAMGLSNFANSRFIYLGEDENGYIGIPRGLTESLTEKCERANISYSIQDERQQGKKIKVTFTGELRQSQKNAVDKMLEHDTGILNAATAFGKTVVCCNMIVQRKVNTLIVLESSELIPQWEKALTEFLEIDEKPPEYRTKTGRIKKRKSVIGTLQGPRDTLTGIVDIAMAGSLCKKGEFHPYLREYGMVLLDESHHGASATIQAVLREVKAKYVYGVTATPIREDGLEKINYMIMGPVRYRFTAKDRAKEQGIVHMVYPRFTRTASLRSQRMHINDAYVLVRDSESRNEQIIEDARECIDNGRCPVVLTRYTEHAKKLYERLQGYASHTFLLLGEKSKRERSAIRSAMEAVPQEETMLLVATGKLIGEGLDFPRLDTLIMATPVAGESVLTQYAGRLNRDYEKKEDVMIYDYIDILVPQFDKMYRKRLAAYKKIGYQICAVPALEKHKAHVVFDIDNYQTVFEEDLKRAGKEITISSPGLSKKKIQVLGRLLKERQVAGVQVTVMTWKMDFEKYGKPDYRATLIEDMRALGFYVVLSENIQDRFAIIDGDIVWYGSLDFLGKEDAEDNLMRVESREAAEELLAISASREDQNSEVK